MAITFVGSASGGSSAGTTFALSLSSISGLAVGDVVLAFAVASGPTPAISGYTTIHSDTTPNCIAGYKVQTGSPDSSITFWDPGSTNDGIAGVALAFRGVDTATPLDVAAVEAESTTNPAAITPNNDNCAIVIFAGELGENDTTPGTITDYSATVVGEADPSGAGNDCCAYGAYRLLSGGAGISENPGAFPSLTLGSQHHAITIALRPGTAGGQPFYIRDIISVPSGGISII